MCGCVVEGDVPNSSDPSAEKTLISVMACVLEQLVTRNDQLPFDPATATVFHGLRSPNVSVRAYLQQIHKRESGLPRVRTALHRPIHAAQQVHPPHLAL